MDIVFESNSMSGTTTSAASPIFSKYMIAPTEPSVDQSDSEEDSCTGYTRHLEDSGFHKYWMPKVISITNKQIYLAELYTCIWALVWLRVEIS